MPLSAISLPCASAKGAANSATSAQIARKSAFSWRIDRERLELGDVEQLAHDPRHALDVLVQRFGDLAVDQGVDAAAQDGERRAQLMRGVGRELALHPKPGLEAIERLVHRLHQRQDLLRNALRRQPHIGSLRIDLLRHLRRAEQRPQSPAEDHDVDGQQEQENRQRDPSDALEEVGNDVVDDHVAMGEILADLDPDRLRPAISFARLTPDIATSARRVCQERDGRASADRRAKMATWSASEENRTRPPSSSTA